MSAHLHHGVADLKLAHGSQLVELVHEDADLIFLESRQTQDAPVQELHAFQEDALALPPVHFPTALVRVVVDFGKVLFSGR